MMRRRVPDAPGSRVGAQRARVPPLRRLVDHAESVARGRVGPDLPDLDEPGSFAFADGDRLDHTLEAAGFRTIDREVLTLPVRIGADVDDVIGYLLAQPEVQMLLAGRSDGQVSDAVAAVRQALAPYAGPDGVVMEMSGWLVTARP